jgi:hypothetical protein
MRPCRSRHAKTHDAEPEGVTRNRKPGQDASETLRRNPRAGASRMVLRMVVSVRLAGGLQFSRDISGRIATLMDDMVSNNGHKRHTY